MALLLEVCLRRLGGGLTKLNQDDEKERGLKKKRLERLMKGRVTGDMKGMRDEHRVPDMSRRGKNQCVTNEGSKVID